MEHALSSLSLTLPSPKQDDTLRILCLGDVVGRPGRQILKEALPHLRKKYSLDMIIANGENAAGGIGLTPETFRELLSAGVDVVTTGNHVWKHRELYPLLEKDSRLLRPENYPAGTPGRGVCVHLLPCGTAVTVINILGRVYMEPVDCPFAAMRRIVEQGIAEELGTVAEKIETTATKQTPAPRPIRIVDFHAEATSEKRAMGHFLDGNATAVVGTHTHVQTADAFVLPGGTATLTDLGMCGIEETSVLGMKKEPVLERFASGLPYPFKPASGIPSLNGALIEVDKTTGKALSLRLLRGTAGDVRLV